MASKSKAKSTRRRNNNGIKLPIAAIAGFMPGIIGPINFWKDQGSQAAAREMARIWTGFDYTDGSWDWGRMKWGLLPAIIGGIVHVFVGGKLGINRALSRAGIPLIRI